MKKLLLTIFAIVLLLPFTAVCQAANNDEPTIKELMNVIHEHYNVNFIYDSSLELDIKAPNRINPSRQSLEECLEALFTGTGIEWEVMKKYIVLTHTDKKRKPKDYTIFIEEQMDTLSESRITAYIDRNRAAAQTGLISIDGNKFKKGYAVLGSPDLIKELQQLPGVSSGTDLLTGLYVHGGDGTDNLFLLNGVPLYQVSHAAGLISSFNTEVVDNIDFYKSGFPSRYGGKLSSVVDVTTRPGDMQEYHGSFNIGLLSGGLQFEGPIVPGRTSFNVAVRRSWFDLVTIPLNIIVNAKKPYGDSQKIHYSMTDFNASVTHLFDKNSRLSFNMFAGIDKLINSTEDLRVRYWDGVKYVGDSGSSLDTQWGNILTSLNWYKKFSDDLHLNSILYYVRSHTGVDMIDLEWKMSDQSSKITDDKKIDRSFSIMNEFAAKTALDWIPSEYHHISVGASYSGRIFDPIREYSKITLVDNEETESLHSSYSVRYNTSEVSAHASDEISVWNWFKANLGLRYTCFINDGMTHHSVEPRAALRFQFAPVVAMKMSYTEMSQAVHLVRANYLDLPLSVWMPTTESVAPMRSREAAGGFYLDLPHNITLNLEGYWKMLYDIYEYSGKDGLFTDISDWEHQLLSGKGRSYGAEMEARWRTEKMDVAAYYTLSWTERYFEGIYHDWFPARTDNRHKLTLTATRKFSDKFEMYSGWHYHTGDRATIPTQFIGDKAYYDSPYNYQMSDYHRLDLGFNFHKTTKRGNESIWNLTLYNAYCRLNPVFAYLKHYLPEGNSEYKTEFVEKSLIPIVPSFNYTLRF